VLQRLLGYRLHHRRRDVRERGLRTVRDQSTLQQIALDRSLDDDIRLQAAARLTDPAAAQVVYSDMAHWARTTREIEKLAPLLTEENRRLLAAEAAEPATVCALLGHELDAACRCQRCGATTHDWEKNPDYSKTNDLWGTCRHCGAGRYQGTQTSTCGACDGTGDTGNPMDACFWCSGSGKKVQEYDEIR